MIKKLKQRYVIIFMIFITIILLLIQGSFYLVSQIQTNQANTRILNQSLGIDESFESDTYNSYNILIVEANFQLNTFIISSNEWNQTEEEIIEMMEIVIANNKRAGILREYNVQYASRTTPFTTTIAFLDLSASKQALNIVMLRTLIINVGLWILSFFIAHSMINKMVQPVESSMLQQQQLVSNLSHELKNPLAIIKANTQILSKKVEEPSLEWVDNIQNESNRMNDLITQMLFLAQSDEQKSQIELKLINLSEHILQVVLPLESLIFEQVKSLELEIEDDVFILGHKTLIKQIVSILMDNALKYSNQNGIIRVTTETTKTATKLHISNTGPTIDPEDQSHLFERFYRADKARSSENSGYGLGLSIAKLIIEQHHGSITVQSQNNKTTFTLHFPPIKKGITKVS